MKSTIAFTYRYKTGEEFRYILSSAHVSQMASGYTINGMCSNTPRPSTFWAANIVSDITDTRTGASIPVREWLAREQGIDPVEFAVVTNEKQYRYLQLIADFSGGFAQGWRFAVGSWFRDTLDIKCVEMANSVPGRGRKKATDTETRWTQGPFYSFSEGHLIYDDPRAYTLRWDEALRVISVSVQVLRGTQNGEGEGDIHSGTVDFSLSRINANHTGLERVGLFSCTQNAFVEFLKTGNLHGETLDQILLEGKK